MTSLTPKLVGYSALAAAALLAALGLRRPELVAVAAPFALIAAAGLADVRRPRLASTVVLDRDRVTEGDAVEVTVELSAADPIARLEVLLDVPRGLSVVEGRNLVAIRIAAGEQRSLTIRLLCERWNAYELGDVSLRMQDRFGLVVHRLRRDHRRPLRVYPRPTTVRSLLRPLETQVHAGNQLSRQKGEGSEFADLRPYVPGDRVRRVNWRATARRRELWVNEFHTERNADVVLFVDSFAEARRADMGTLDLAVRAAAALAAQYLREKDRVGLVGFGGTLTWLLPGSGRLQLLRIVDALLESGVVLSYAWRDVLRIPRRILPPKALVLALTPLLDERSVAALADLRGRGYDVAVVEVSPLPFVPVGRGETGDLAHRLWLLQRDALRWELERAGVPVARWDTDRPLPVALEEVRRFRRRPARVRV